MCSALDYIPGSPGDPGGVHHTLDGLPVLGSGVSVPHGDAVRTLWTDSTSVEVAENFGLQTKFLQPS